jgi:hypothetical protein
LKECHVSLLKRAIAGCCESQAGIENVGALPGTSQRMGWDGVESEWSKKDVERKDA